MLLLPFAILGVYALALIDFIRLLPITSFLNPQNIGASWYIHPVAGIARINGRLVHLLSGTTAQAPARVCELGHPASLALDLATFATTPVPPRSATGGLAAVQMVILVWLCAVLTLWLAVKARTNVSSTRVLANGTPVPASSVPHPNPSGMPPSFGPATASAVLAPFTPVNYHAESRADLYALCGLPRDVAVIDPQIQPVTLNADRAVFTFSHVALDGGGESAISAVPSAATAFVHQDSQGHSFPVDVLFREPVVIHPVHPTRLILNADKAAVVEMWCRLGVFVAQVERE
ncbi:hypothetical protein JB92DRAFT_378108 [Gautieria morchelliformis]|nr:hypothetical protein JB92DRAFT_378108 [Gautieria morchelliformis]